MTDNRSKEWGACPEKWARAWNSYSWHSHQGKQQHQDPAFSLAMASHCTWEKNSKVFTRLAKSYKIWLSISPLAHLSLHYPLSLFLLYSLCFNKFICCGSSNISSFFLIQGLSACCFLCLESYFPPYFPSTALNLAVRAGPDVMKTWKIN